ncbi:MAG: tRNA-specific adenosine deaminase [Chitinivibrionales bacterium]|nr:tRNA-specific adenosine deaminase [Chitinivibrionales bacterium]
MTPDYFMNLAYQEALKAFDEGEAPIGAVIAKDGKLIGKGYNRIEKPADPTAHAEIIAIGSAASFLQSWRLDGCTLYVTLEPCLMCLGAIMQSRITAVEYAAKDPRLGAVDTFYYQQEIQRSYKRFPLVSSGLMQEQCSQLLTSFFKQLRKKN